jgi:Excalibur calcium-binding domain
MRLRNIAVATVLAAGATLPLAGIANAQPDRDCPDFSSQAEAQEALDSVPGDPERLDSDGDGIACESQFGEPTTTAAPTTTPASAPSASTTPAPAPSASTTGGQVRVLPQGGIDTGDGSTVGEPVSGPALITLAGLVAVATTAAATSRRGHRSH